MATTQIADAIVPDVFASYLQELTLEKSLLIRSGIIQRNLELEAFLAGGGRYLEMPKWQELSDDNEANNSSTADTLAPIDNVDSRQEDGVRINRNKIFGARDLVSQLAGSDPMDAIAERFANWWVRHDQRLLLSVIAGLMLDDTSDTGTVPDLLNDVSVDGSPAAAANQFSANNLLDTFQLLGDAKSNVTAIAVHSYIHTEMQKQGLIDFVPNQEADIGWGTYMGKSILVDDGLTVDTTTTDGSNPQPTYDTVCFAPGAFQFGFGSPRVPVAVDRDERAGHGGGEEFMVTRREFVMHPVGFTFDTTTASADGASPTNAVLAADGAYSRVDADGSRQRAQRIVVLRSN